MSESSNRQQPSEDDWTQILYKIDWKNVDLTLHAKNEAGEEITVSLPTMAEVVEKPIRLPDNSTIYKDLEDRLVKHVLLDGSIVSYLYEGIAKFPHKITLKHFSGTDEVEHTAFSLKDQELNYSFIGSITEANIFHHKAIRNFLAASVEIFGDSGRPLGVIHADGTEFEYGFMSALQNEQWRETVKVEAREEVTFFGKLNNQNNTYEISMDAENIEIGTDGIENINLSLPTLGVKATLAPSSTHLNLSNNSELPIYIYRKGGKNTSLFERSVIPLQNGDRLKFADKKTLVDVNKCGNAYRLSGGKKPTILKKDTPYVVNDLHFSLGNHGTDYEVTNIVGAKVDISPVKNNIAGATAEIHNSGSKAIRIVRGSETILLSPGERAGLENDDLLSYDIETKLKFNHTFEGLILELVDFRDKTAGAKTEIDDLETYTLQNLIGDGFTDSNIIKRHVSNNTLEALGFIRLYEVGAEENEKFGYFVHELTNLQVQKVYDKIVEIRLPSRERTSGPNFSESVISIEWYENQVYKISITGKKGYADVLRRLIAGRRQQKTKTWQYHVEADRTLPFVPEDQILLAKCIKHPSQMKNLDIPALWSDNPDEEAFEALPDGKVIYVLMPTNEAEYFKCIVDEKTKYIFSLTNVSNQKIREHIYSPCNPNNTGDLWSYLKEKKTTNDTIASTVVTTPAIVKSVNIDISRFGLIIRKPDEYSLTRAIKIHPSFTLSRPQARHCIGLGQRSEAGSDENCEIQIGNASSSLFHIINDINGPILVESSDLNLSSLEVFRFGEKMNFETALELHNDDKIIIFNKSISGKRSSKQVFKVEINPDAMYLLHVSSLIKLHSIAKYSSSLNSQLNEFRAQQLKKENIESKLDVELLLYGVRPKVTYKSYSTNNLNFSPYQVENSVSSQAEFIWIEDPEPFRSHFYCLIHHTLVNSEREVRVIPTREGMVDISTVAGFEKVAFLRAAQTEYGYLDYWIANPYDSNKLMLLSKDACHASMLEGGPEIKLNHGDTFLIQNHAFTLASVDEFENFEFSAARLKIPNDTSKYVHEVSSQLINMFNVIESPLALIEAGAYVLPINEMNELLDDVPEEVFENAELRMLLGEVVVFSKVLLANGEERNIFLLADTDNIPIDLLVLTILKRAEEENLNDIAIPIMAPKYSATSLFDTVVSPVEGLKLANCNIEIKYSVGINNKKLAELIKSEVNLQNQNLAFCKLRASFIKLLEHLKFEMSNVSKDIFIPLDTTNSMANAFRNLRLACERIDYSVNEPKILAEELNAILDILGLVGRFEFLQKADNMGKLQFLMKDKISEGNWRDVATIKISEQPNSAFFLDAEKNHAIEEFSAKLSMKNMYVQDAYLNSIKTIIKNLEKSGMSTDMIEEVLSESIERANVRHLLMANFKNNHITIKNRVSTSKPALTVFSIDTGLTSTAEIEESPEIAIPIKKSNKSTGEGGDIAKRLKDFFAAENAKRIEERIKLETSKGTKEALVLLRQTNQNIVIVKLDEPLEKEVSDFELPNWKLYSELPSFHYAGRSYRYDANGTVFTAIKGIIELAEDLYAFKDDSILH